VEELNRNDWKIYAGISGRTKPERVEELGRITQSVSITTSKEPWFGFV
jgi:hypothetical protein